MSSVKPLQHDDGVFFHVLSGSPSCSDIDAFVQ